jgi:hypothetical protein
MKSLVLKYNIFICSFLYLNFLKIIFFFGYVLDIFWLLEIQNHTFLKVIKILLALSHEKAVFMKSFSKHTVLGFKIVVEYTRNNL